ncbi:MAG TPA: carboxypeptidase regulatory-like domain-containing protein [Vicinamibacterales bacterium]|nr:carboxypeptidase regulatory-like domain-containing protein [Vicinamibacterales bacterium]
MRRIVLFVIGVLFFEVFSPGRALAQQASGIAGTVRDASGGVLPGVAVEASSPALIERVRAVVTDGEGRYNIVNLPPGTYTVAFTLQGFSTFRREGIVLNAGFNAAVNADLQVSTVAETITVSGETPLVDTQNVRRQTVVTDEALDVLPTSIKNANALIGLTLGLNGIADVGGIYATQVGSSFHGKGGARTQFDGMSVQNMTGNAGYQLNPALVSEMTLQASGITAEGNAEGVLINMVPKEGGNQYAGTISGLYTNQHLAGDNLNADLIARQLTSVNKPINVYDATATLGGPVKKDKLWFFASAREWGNNYLFAGFYWNKTQGTPFYTPDTSRPATRTQWFESKAVRMTWQAAQKHKLSFFGDFQDACICRTGTTVAGSGVGVAPEAILSFHFRPTGFYQASWTAPVTTRLLLDGGMSATINHWPQFRAPGVTKDTISILEQSTGIRYNARETYDDPNVQDRYGERFSLSYVTGTHALKFGVQDEQGFLKAYRSAATSNYSYTFNLGRPVSITQYATPYELQNRFKHDLGIYAQDQWAIHRLTLNLGLRYDYFNGYVPPQHVAATPNGWLPERSYPEIKNVPLWKDLNPRVGGAYDLFGNGKTALKASLGRYVSKSVVEIANANNPIVASVNQVTRSWNDNGNFILECDLANRAQNGECGPLQNQNFGNPVVTTRYSDAVLKGFGVRPYNWDMSVEVQHQIGRDMSVSAGYYRNWYGNFRVTDNLSVEPSDFSQYCVTAPADVRLPNGGGYQVCGLYDISTTKFGQANNLVRPAKDFGKQKQISDFFTFSMDARFASGARLGGGVDTGRTTTDTCFVVDSPQQKLNCHVTSPFSGNTQIKVNGSYPLPREFFVSALYQNLSGPNYTADWAAPTTLISQSLGRDLAGGVRSAVVPLLTPNTYYDKRTTRLDLRMGKNIKLTPRVKVQGNVDLYNVTNSGSVLQDTTAYGGRWLVPTLVLEPRILQFSAQVTF